MKKIEVNKELIVKAWDEAEEIVTSILELTDEELVKCKQTIISRAARIMNHLNSYVDDEDVVHNVQPQEEIKATKATLVHLCQNCNSDNVQFKTWTNANSFKATNDECPMDIQDTWCRDCETRSGFIVKLKNV